MTKINSTSPEILVAEVMSTINTLSVKLDQLSTKKKALTELTDSTTVGKVLNAHKASIKKITEESKTTRLLIEKEIKRVDVFSAAKMVTSLCISPEDSDAAYRQKISRRRNALKSCLTKTFTDFDFRSDKRGNMAVITPVYVGNEHFRKANDMLSTVTELQECGFNIEAIDRDKLAGILEAQAGTMKTYADKVVDDNVPSVDDTLTALNDLIETTTAGEKVAEKAAEKVAGK